MNTPGGNTVSAAEHTIALLMALARHVPAADAAMKAGGWDRNKFLGTQLAGKTLGVIGLGRIGREVARRARGLDMKVVGFDPFVTSAKAAELGIEAGGRAWTRCLPQLDFLTAPRPADRRDARPDRRPRTGHDEEVARVLNVARGGIINEQALADALKAGHHRRGRHRRVRQEPTPADHPLRRRPNVVLTPHLGASHRRGPGERRPRGGAADRRLPAQRGGRQRGQHGRGGPRRAGGAAAVRRPGPPARAASGAARARFDQAGRI